MPFAWSQSAAPTPTPTEQTPAPTDTEPATPTITPTPTATTGQPTPTQTQSLAPSPSSAVATRPTASARATTTAKPTPGHSLSQPAVATSNLPPATILIAVAVLVAAAVILVVANRRARTTRSSEPELVPHPARTSNTEPVGPQETVTFLAALGRAMVDSGDPVTHIQETLRRIAHSNGVSAAGIVVLPTALIVSLAWGAGPHDIGHRGRNQSDAAGPDRRGVCGRR